MVAELERQTCVPKEWSVRTMWGCSQIPTGHRGDQIMPSALRAAPHACQDGIVSMCGLLCVASVQPKFEPLQAVSYEFYKANAASMSQGLL